MIKKILSFYLWLIPFIIFFLTFFVSYLFFSQEKRIVPSVLYKNTAEALSLLKEANLNCRMLKEKESAWPAGTVIAQSPAPGKSIKAFQTVFVTLAQEQPTKPIACTIGHLKDQAALLFDTSYTLIWHSVFSSHIQNMCIAQIETLKQIDIYVASNKSDHVLMPSFIGSRFSDCKEVLDKYNLKFNVFHTSHQHQKHHCYTCFISEQYPAPGTIISLSSPALIQLKI